MSITGEGLVTVAGEGEARRATPPPYMVPVENGQRERVVATPVRSALVKLGGVYEGQEATMRLNPRRSVVKALFNGEEAECTGALASIILTWNFGDEDGQPLAITPENIADLPNEQFKALLNGYFAAFEEATAAPKASGEASSPMRTTSDEHPTAAGA